MIQPDIGQTLLILSSWAILIFTSGVNIYIFSIFILLSFSSLLYVVMFVPKFAYIQKRIFSFFNSETGTHNFQSDKAIESISSGGFFGKGLGEGTLKNRVPEAHTDYIVSVISASSMISSGRASPLAHPGASIDDDKLRVLSFVTRCTSDLGAS